MGKLRRTSRDRQSETFADFWSDESHCYRLKVKQAIPDFYIAAGSIISASKLAPHRDDLIIVAVPGRQRQARIGRFIRMNGSMVVFESAGGPGNINFFGGVRGVYFLR